MRRKTTPGPVKGRESLSKLGSFQNDTKLTSTRATWDPRNRVAILEEIAESWVTRGYYKSAPRAMAALLGVSE
jgi:hypothetical protein